MKKSWIVISILAVVAYGMFRQSQSPAPEIEEPQNLSFGRQKQDVPAKPTATPVINPVNPANVPVSRQQAPMPVQRPKDASPAEPQNKPVPLPYTLEDGLVVVQGDLVVGTPTQEDAPERGMVEVPTMRLWPSSVIPYHIDSSLKNPDRVREALALFEGTAVHFVPFSGEKDAIVFLDGNGTCKSYVGKIGGHQPIWLPADCGAREIAHEIMHALGFIHEQNRNDRDSFIQVSYENIDEKFKDNFEKLPGNFMKASGLGPFDFDSLMIYPVWMFAKSGKTTMQSKVRDHQIQPSPTLSRTDIERVNQLFGSLPEPQPTQAPE